MGTLAIVIGATGGIGSALVRVLDESGPYDRVVGLSRRTHPGLDLLDETSIQAAAKWVAGQGDDLRLVFDATGALTLGDRKPEKSLRELDPQALAESYAINAIGPALVMKHFLRSYPRMAKASLQHYRRGLDPFQTTIWGAGTVTGHRKPPLISLCGPPPLSSRGANRMRSVSRFILEPCGHH
jgi:NAD(P)-dependent dehydrogenase (short-subunit alcohol dehydrogenase family)